MTRKRSSQRLEEEDLSQDLFSQDNTDGFEQLNESSDEDDVLKFNERVKSVINILAVVHYLINLV